MPEEPIEKLRSSASIISKLEIFSDIFSGTHNGDYFYLRKLSHFRQARNAEFKSRHVALRYPQKNRIYVNGQSENFDLL